MEQLAGTNESVIVPVQYAN